MRRKVRIYSFVISVMLLFITVLPATAADIGQKDSTKSTQTIRVAFPMQEGLTKKDAQGNYSGYTYDYLQEIAQYTGWEYEFVEVPGDINESLTTMLDMLAGGEIDIMGSLLQNEQTQETYDFPEYGYGYSYTNLAISEDNTSINETNLQSIKNLRIAALTKGQRAKLKAEDFCKLNNIQYTFVDCDSGQDVLDTVKNGDADVILANDLTPFKGFRTVAQFGGSQFYFGITKGRSDLVSTLNSTILTIKQVKPYFESSLHEKYFSNRSYKTYLTDEEKAYVKSADPLKVAVVTTLAPVQYKDKNGNIAGITKDILNRVEKETGLKIEYIPADSFDEAYDMLSDDKVSAVCGIPYDYKAAQEANLVMSNSLLSAQVVMVTKDKTAGNTSGKTAAVVNGRQIENDDPNVKLKSFDGVADCMKAIASGKVDYSYLNLYSAEYLSHYDEFKDMRLIPQADKTMDYCLGLKKPADTVLVSLINRVLSNISEADMESIVYQNSSRGDREITLRSFIQQNPMLSIGILSAFFLILAGIGISIYRFRTKAIRKLNIESQKYLLLSELTNEFIYEYDIEKDTLIFSKKFADLLSLPDKITGVSDIESGSVVHTDIPQVAIHIYHEAAAAVESADTEHLCQLSDGTYRWYRNTSVKIKDVTGQTISIIGKLTDIQHEKEEKEKLKKQSRIDGLTGVYNAAYTKNKIQNIISSLPEPAALLVIDIDKFKAVNDCLGHYTGDIVLKDFAQMLQDVSGPHDIAGRIGGDEFMVFAGAAKDMNILTQICEDICTHARKSYTSDTGETIDITASIGCIHFRSPADFNELYQAADKLLYESKRKGRDCFTITEFES